ncbi:MAG TPA: carboxypeptidase regulatory-like domain-containing protein [Burkholderiaceae bacterium]|nr:carboxypeptidase regulatory-like domain-containing protein [Burkholderiaceae bacterium]
MQRPRQWAWALAFALSTLVITGCGGGSNNTDTVTTTPNLTAGTGRIEGVALASSDGAPIADATVSAGGKSAKTAADGTFTLDGLTVGAAALTIQANGFSGGLVPVDVVAGRSARAEARLVREGTKATVDAASAATVTVPGSTAAVSFAANALVTEGGSVPSGAVTVRLTPIDPASDPRSMPGVYRADSGQAIESMGALSVTLADATGKRVNLKSGSSATIRIPLASRASDPPPTIPLYYLDEASGRWVQQGSATLKADGSGRYYEGTVDRLTYWNADRPLDSIVVHGCVNDAAGKPAAGAYVSSVGVDYSGVASAWTDAQGRFEVAMRKYGQASVAANDDTHASTPALAGPSGTGITLPDCLVLNQPGLPPEITVGPTDTTTWEDGQAVFLVIARGQRLSYQWRRDGVDIPGATGDWYAVPRARLTDSGSQYTVVARNAAGSVTSSSATLTVKVSDPQKKVADLRLLGLGFEFAGSAFSALELVDDNLAFVAPGTACSSGSMNATLDSAALVAGRKAPPSGTLATTFSTCTIDDTTYSGSDSVSYSAAADFSSITATATLVNLRRQSPNTAFGTDPGDTTANGSLGMGYSRSVANGDQTVNLTLSPGAGSTLRNESTGRTASFATGAMGFSNVQVQVTAQCTELKGQCGRMMVLTS